MIRRKLQTALLVFAVLTIICDLTRVAGIEAAGKKSLALKSYEKYLLSDNINIQGNRPRFALIDLNQDRVPELVVTSDGGYHLALFAYHKGKTDSLWSDSGADMKFYPNKHLFFSHHNNHGVDAFQYGEFNGKELKWRALKSGSMDYNAVTGKPKTKIDDKNPYAPYRYEVNGKKTTKAAYQSKVKSLVRGAKEKKLQWHDNNASNRKKYLK